MATSTTDETARGYPRSETGAAMLARLVADALTASVSKLREDDEMRMSQFTTTLQEFAAFREAEESRLARLEKAITDSKPPPTNIDPTTTFWTVYNRVADEYDNDVVSKYLGDLDTTLLFSGLFSAVVTAIVVQVVPAFQSGKFNPTVALVLRMLQQTTSFDESDPPTPTQGSTLPFFDYTALIFTSLSLTLFVAFFAAAGRQWIANYTRATKRGNLADRGMERQVKFIALQKWRVLVIIDLLPILLQISLYLFSTGLVIPLATSGSTTAAYALYALTLIGIAFFLATLIITVHQPGRPFQTPASVLLLLIIQWIRENGWTRDRLSQGLRSLIASRSRVDQDLNDDHYMTLSNPLLWRLKPLFTSHLPKDIAASAAIWLLENSTDVPVAPAVAAAFSGFQWPSYHHSTTTLTRLRDMYMECLWAPKFDDCTRLKALQSAAAYYTVYHTHLVRNTSKGLSTGLKNLPPDLLVDNHTGEWGGDGVFEYLLHTEHRSGPMMSARFLSYIAPYWFCGDSDSAIQSRPSRLEKLHELIDLLERSQAFTPATLANCVLCVGAAMDFPLHPEDLVRVDKSEYLQVTFEKVVEHIHSMVLGGGRRHPFAAMALGILSSLAKKPTFPSVDAAWITGLIDSAAEWNMDRDTFALFLGLRGLENEGGDTVGMV